MRINLTFLLTLLFVTNSIWAQDDDVYFVPSKAKSSKEMPKSGNPTYDTDDYEESTWAEGRATNRDIDEYNRRTSSRANVSDSLNNLPDEALASGTYTERIIRFHSPTGVYVSSPYYSDYIDIWFDPWMSPFPYSTWGSFYSWNYWNSWYSWTHWGPYPSYWWGGWYDPWWCHHHYHPWPGYYPGHHPHYPGGGVATLPGAKRGPHGGYVVYGNGNTRNNNHSTTRNNHRPSRNYGSSPRQAPSREYRDGNSSNRRNYNQSSTPSRNFGNSGNRSGINTTPSRNMGGQSHGVGGGSRGGSRSFGGRR